MTLDDLRAMGISDADIAGLLSFDPSSLTIGGGQDEAARALAAAQATGLSNLGYVPVYGGGDIIPGTTQGILSRLGIENPYTPIFQTVGSENSGTAMDATERTTFAPTPGQTYRLVDNRTGETFGEASDPVGIKALVDRANALSEEQGKKANWDLQQSTLYSDNPNQPLKQGWNTIAQDDPNTIPMSIKAMMAAMAVMTGAGVAQQINAANAAAAGAGGAGGAGSGLVPGALEGLSFAPVGTAAVPASTIAGAVGAAAVPAAVTAGTDLVVTALMAKGFTAAQAAALVASGGAAAALSSTAGAAGTMPPATTTGPDLLLTAQQAGSTVPAVVPAATAATIAAAAATTPPPNPAEDLTLTAQTQPTNLVPASLLAGGGAAAAAAANAAGSTTSATDLANSRTGMTDAELAAVNAGAGGTSFLDKIISNMGVMDYATLASLAASAVGGGGGGSTGATTPYVSPFGAGTNFGGFAGRTQVNPNITDYEKYGFGPEAQFFSGIATSPGAIAPPATTPAATTPAATTPAASPAATPAASPAATPAANLLDSAASARLTLSEGTAPTGAVTQIGGNLGPSTPANTGMTQDRLDQLQTRYENMRTPEFFQYFKSVNDVLGTYVNRGYMTPEQAKAYQGRLETAASSPNASLASLQSAVPMPQIGDFRTPTGTPTPVTYTAPAQPITDRSAYINDLYKQLGANVSQGLLAVPQAQTLQSQLRQAYLNPQSTTEQLQGIYNTGMQQYKPLI